jgi:hypothetical protein
MLAMKSSIVVAVKSLSPRAREISTDRAAPRQCKMKYCAKGKYTVKHFAYRQVGRNFGERIVADVRGPALLALVSMLFGCGSDRQESTNTSSAQGGAGVTGGTASTAVTGGSTNGRSNGGTIGVGGNAVTGGAPGIATCKAAPDPNPQLLASTSFGADTLARAAAVLGSCRPDDGVDRNATHLWSSNLSSARIYFKSATQLSCLANADCGCAGADHCLGWNTSTTSASCNPGCSGTTFTACGAASGLPDGTEVTIDCSKIGQICDANLACAEQPTVTCDSATYAASCDLDGRPLYCYDGVVQRGPNCAALGLNCSLGLCVGRGATCINQSYSQPESVVFEGTSCSGDTMTACVNGHVTTVSCSTMGPGFSCQTVGTQYFCGLASECAPADNYAASKTHPASCSGSTLTYCNAGRLEHIDCTSLGFSGCDINPSIQHYGCI